MSMCGPEASTISSDLNLNEGIFDYIVSTIPFLSQYSNNINKIAKAVNKKAVIVYTPYCVLNINNETESLLKNDYVECIILLPTSIFNNLATETIDIIIIFF